MAASPIVLVSPGAEASSGTVAQIFTAAIRSRSGDRLIAAGYQIGERSLFRGDGWDRCDTKRNWLPEVGQAGVTGVSALGRNPTSSPLSHVAVRPWSQLHPRCHTCPTRHTWNWRAGVRGWRFTAESIEKGIVPKLRQLWLSGPGSKAR